MNFNFHKSEKPRRQRLFIPLSSFSFASFVVPMKFRQPAAAVVIRWGARFLRSQAGPSGNAN